MAIRSMTGFARVRRQIAQGELVLSVKSVNHRGLDLHFQMPPSFDAYETAMRAIARRMMARGHLDIRVQVQSAGASQPLALNEELLDSYVTAIREAARRHSLNIEPDLNAALRLPGMLEAAESRESDAGLEAALCEALSAALEELNAVRQREGADTAKVIEERVRAVGKSVVRVREIRNRAVPAFQNRLRERLTELLDGVGLEPQRLIQEAAVLTDRSDIGEEIARLEIHNEQVMQLLERGGEAGKKLDFLLQEMNRETNTMLSKTNGIGEQGIELTEIALSVKADIEKIREQSLNLE